MGYVLMLDVTNMIFASWIVMNQFMGQ